MKTLYFVLVTLSLSSLGSAREALQTTVTLEGNSALEFFKLLNVPDQVNTAGANTAHFRNIAVSAPSSGKQISVNCSYVEKGGRNENASCDFNFYVNNANATLD